MTEPKGAPLAVVWKVTTQTGSHTFRDKTKAETYYDTHGGLALDRVEIYRVRQGGAT